MTIVCTVPSEAERDVGGGCEGRFPLMALLMFPNMIRLVIRASTTSPLLYVTAAMAGWMTRASVNG